MTFPTPPTDKDQKVTRFITENNSELISLGLFFLRILAADLRVLSPRPSPTAFVVLKMKEGGKLGQKDLFDLMREMEASGIEMLTDGFGGSMLNA